ncbi:MAG: SDR family NAD-dependent epimerase/dehydratase, partial [Acidobacteriota bacterium]|nr:SDR family NAD-dependent epimerase/dehydratase [Acidobacteriota bacterium]
QLMMETEAFIGPLNLGNPKEFTILELAEKILHLTKSSSKIIHEPLPPDDPVRRCPDISLAKEKLNWEPKIDLDEGLTRTIDYFRERLCIND